MCVRHLDRKMIWTIKIDPIFLLCFHFLAYLHHTSTQTNIKYLYFLNTDVFFTLYACFHLIGTIFPFCKWKTRTEIHPVAVSLNNKNAKRRNDGKNDKKSLTISMLY